MLTKVTAVIASFIISAIAGYFIYTLNVAKKVPVEEKVTSKISVIQTPTPSPLPKSTPYEAEVDLNKELEGIDPQVKESDFNNLNQLITEFN